MPTSSSRPSSTPSEVPFVFDGIDDAGSLFRGVISILWDFPHYDNGDIVDLESVRYHILSYAGSFDFKSVLENSNYTAETLISDFEVNSLNETTGIQYHLVDDGEAFEFELNTTFYGKMHSLLVIAEVEGVYSRNTDAIDVYASEVDPVLKENLNIVGIFIPTDLLDITVNEDNSMIEFDGPVRQEHKDIVAGDYVWGITRSQEFFLLVTSVVESSDQRVVLSTEAPKLEDIFDQMDFEMAVGMSRPDKVDTSPSSRHRHRHLIQRRQRRLHGRRLFLSTAWNGFWNGVGQVWEGAKRGIETGWKWVGDNIVTPTVEAIEKVVNLVTNGEVEKSFELIAFYYSYTFEVEPLLNSTLNSTLNGTGIEGEVSVNGQLDVKVDVRSDIYAAIKVSLNSPNFQAEAGWRASYSADFNFLLAGDSELILTTTLKEWEKTTYQFQIGPVPVLFDAKPKIDGKFSVKTSSDGGGVARLNVGKCYRIASAILFLQFSTKQLCAFQAQMEEDTLQSPHRFRQIFTLTSNSLRSLHTSIMIRLLKSS
jgi:hypothetical protein